MNMPVAPTLNQILNEEAGDDALALAFGEADVPEKESAEDSTPAGFCVECKDQEAQVYCEQCQEDFCEVCSGMIHRTGRRKQHAQRNIQKEPAVSEKMDTDEQNEDEAAVTADADDHAEEALDSGAFSVTFSAQSGKVETEGFSEWIKERAKYIPLRLTLKERKYLRLLEAALNVSEYTDKVDILMYGDKTKRIVGQIKELCAILSGLVLASDYKAGQRLFEDREFGENEEFYRRVFEIGRRHKIMNPERMRNEYGKLMFMLQDAQTNEVKKVLGMDLVAPVKTVHSVLEALDIGYLLEDEMVVVATREIVEGGKTRAQVQLEIKQKERAVEYLCKAYATDQCPAEVIRQCLYSIGDNHAYLRFTRDACERMRGYLSAWFEPKKAESDDLSLAIFTGRSGARLTHSHESQYHYVMQTLTLWREMLHDMFMLWHHADGDLLDSRNPYRLKDTGQGLNRVQQCSRVSRTVHNILYRTQKAVGRWVGSSMVHLGDRNVPNALMFIDKYNQVASILNPVVRVIEFLERLESQPERNAEAREMVERSYGGTVEARKRILADFFRSAFDGSGADNFFDAGSCIDGRLTSAWNWCSNIEKKPYFNVFLLSGFVGFNGGPEGYN
ncbi:hypothetical protein GGI15_003591 [Coemansia interrupta]|uniref:B box-type domain-containing protein n=1 Tax=Coemansia interrupta TaxID=1126814 RepID=A0A9W8H8F3_9FUNG|nr:hypothetical protein GGI15_003591 [Coemansia interrupta]